MRKRDGHTDAVGLLDQRTVGTDGAPEAHQDLHAQAELRARLRDLVEHLPAHLALATDVAVVDVALCRCNLRASVT